MEKVKTLVEIATFFGTDKEVPHKVHGDGHRFCSFYDYHLSSIRMEKLKILEICIFDGASLKMWEEYFQNSVIFGVDNLSDPRARLVNEGRVFSFRLDAGDRDSLTSFESTFGPFDVVIDDGSHFTNHQWISWDVFKNKCKVFIWEDLHTSRMPNYINSKQGETLPLDYAKRLASEYSSNNFIFDRDGDEKHVTFLKKNEY